MPRDRNGVAQRLDQPVDPLQTFAMPPSSRSNAQSKPTINDVAARAGVSKKTISRVINGSEGLSDATRERVERAIADLGYVPNPQARALAFGRNFTLALLHDNPNAQTVLNFQRGVLDAIRDSDLALVVRPVDRNSPAMLDDIRNFIDKQRPLGVLILPPVSEREDLKAMLVEAGVRYVRVGSAALDDPSHCVASNDSEAVVAACQSMIALGHRRIGFVRGPEGFLSAREREKGFRQAMAAAGISIDDSLVTTGTYRFDSGIVAGAALLDRPDPPTAIFSSNDEMAAGVTHAALQAGLRVPEDVSVIGFDDSPTALHIWPSLTTVRWPIQDMGRIAAQKLAGEFMGMPKLVDLPVTLPSLVIERNSVAPPRQR